MNNKMVFALYTAIVIFISYLFFVTIQRSKPPSSEQLLIEYVKEYGFNICSELGVLGKTTEAELLTFPYAHVLNSVDLGDRKRNIYGMVSNKQQAEIYFKFDQNEFLRTVTIRPFQKSEIYLNEWTASFGTPDFIDIGKGVQSKWITIYLVYNEGVVLQIKIAPNEKYYDEICHVSFDWKLSIKEISFVSLEYETEEISPAKMISLSNGWYGDWGKYGIVAFEQGIMQIPKDGKNILITNFECDQK